MYISMYPYTHMHTQLITTEDWQDVYYTSNRPWLRNRAVSAIIIPIYFTTAVILGGCILHDGTCRVNLRIVKASCCLAAIAQVVEHWQLKSGPWFNPRWLLVFHKNISKPFHHVHIHIPGNCFWACMSTWWRLCECCYGNVLSIVHMWSNFYTTNA